MKSDVTNQKICTMLNEVMECIEKDDVKRGLDVLINGTKLNNIIQKDFNGSLFCLQIINMWLVSEWKEGAIELIIRMQPRIMELKL